MRPRFGIGVVLEGAILRIACVRSARVEWMVDASVDGGDDPWAVLDATIARVPSGAMRSAAAAIAVARPFAQLRVVSGLPQGASPAVERELVAASPGRWFLSRPGGLHVSAIEDDADGARRAVAIPRSVLDGMRAALESHGAQVRFGAFAPDAAENARETDCDIRPEFAVAVSMAHHALSGTCPRYAIPGFGSDEGTVTWRRARVAWFGVAASLTLAALAWPFAVLTTTHQLGRVSAGSPALILGDSLEGAIGQTLHEQTALSLRMRGVSSIRVLESIRAALPREIAVVAFRMDSTGGQLTVLGRRVGPLADELAATGRLRDVRLIGAVTTEASAGSLMERATLAFTIGPPAVP